MSADLLSEFDPIYASSRSTSTPAQSSTPAPPASTFPTSSFFPPPPKYSTPPPAPLPLANEATNVDDNGNDDDDDFGSFTPAPSAGQLQDPPPTPEKPVEMRLGRPGMSTRGGRRGAPGAIQVGPSPGRADKIAPGPPTPRKDEKFAPSRTRPNGSVRHGSVQSVDLLSTNAVTTATIPDAFTLLVAFPPLFSLPQTLLIAKLSGLSYPLRRRILSHEKTQQFLSAFLEIVRVCGRIVAFLNKPTIPPRTSSEKRHISVVTSGVVDEYTRVRRQLISLGVGELKVPTLEGSLRVRRAGSSEADKEVCELCRLMRGDICMELREELGDGWWLDGRGHRGCIGFWEEIYGRGWGG